MTERVFRLLQLGFSHRVFLGDHLGGHALSSSLHSKRTRRSLSMLGRSALDQQMEKDRYLLVIFGIVNPEAAQAVAVFGLGDNASFIRIFIFNFVLRKQRSR